MNPTRKRLIRSREKLLAAISAEPGAVVGRTVAVVARLSKRGRQYYLWYNFRNLRVKSKRLTERSYKRSALAITKAAVLAKRVKVAPPKPPEEVKKQYWRALKAYKLVSSENDYSLFTIYAYAFFDHHPNWSELEQVEMYVENLRNQVLYQSFRRPDKIYNRFHDDFGASDVRQVDEDEVLREGTLGDIHSYVLFRKDIPVDVSEAGSLSQFMHSRYTGSYFGVVGHASYSGY